VVKKSLLLKMQELILGTGTAIWWLTEPHCLGLDEIFFILNEKMSLKYYNKSSLSK
jgi:hypothetical protein